MFFYTALIVTVTQKPVPLSSGEEARIAREEEQRNRINRLLEVRQLETDYAAKKRQEYLQRQKEEVERQEFEAQVCSFL